MRRPAVLPAILFVWLAGCIPGLAGRPAALGAQAAADSSATAWDVNRPFGPADTVRFQTSEGTWMNLDVSPDGQTIVFDLLGDLYTLPIGGGTARRLTWGLALDMQPRFSPDGQSIAFTSDRDGLNNLWLMKPDGTGLRQVTKEVARDVNSPTWSSDGQYLYARKHFVEQRSLGAGEVWAYHLSGGTGLKVTDRGRTWQKDAGEPALSPDGKWLYYSKDVTPGILFEYNKDPYAGIYAIVRRDLHDGTERTLTGGAGGAVTPRPSPDGKTLAFIRRVRLNTVLHVKDLATGKERPLWDGLERDMQETWAIHGVYTQYAWTPDGRALVIWAGGKLWRVDSRSGAAKEIPFTAAVEQVVHRALRFQPRVAEAEFPVRMLRDVATRPGGGAVAYSALGRVYLRDLPEGTARRLTADARLEFDPSFAPDGAAVVYTTWTDVDAGRVRVAAVEGGAGRDVVAVPGHYVEPSYSPDGAWIVFRAIRADGVRGRLHGEDPGIFVVPADGSTQPRRVTRQGREPMFDRTGNRIFLRGIEERKQILYSVNLTGGDRIVHFRSDNATEIVPSPDGQWVAFAERYRAYITPFPRSGRPVDIGPTTKTHPVAQISSNAGIYLHWASDSRTVHWSLGPEYFSRALGESFSFVEGGREKPSEPVAAGIDVGFTTQTDTPTGAVAFVGARVVTMSAGGGEAVIENGTVVVRGNRITAVGPTGRVAVPVEAHRVNAAGKTIIPGFVDVHAHVGGESEGLLAESSWPLLANVAFGVTTSHDPSNNTQTVFTNSEMIRAGAKLGPRLFSTGTILYGAEGSFKAVVKTAEDAKAHLARMKAVGAFSVKSYNQRRRDARQMIVAAARELEMMVVPEGGSLVYTNMTMVNDGHTGIEHALPIPKVYQDLATLFGKSGTGYTPTIIVGYGGVWGENYWYQKDDVWENEHLLAFVPREVIDGRSRRRLKAASEADYNHIDIARGAKTIQDAGGLVQLGAHGQVQGLGVHWELWMFVQGGMTPMEALRVGTLNGAKYLGLDGELGSIEVGKLADMVILGANPLDDIRNSTSVEHVVLNGRLYDAKTLAELGDRTRKAPVLYWQRER